MNQIAFRIINFLAILLLVVGFCYECRLLYLGTYLLMFSELANLNLLLAKKWKETSINQNDENITQRKG